MCNAMFIVAERGGGGDSYRRHPPLYSLRHPLPQIRQERQTQGKRDAIGATAHQLIIITEEMLDPCFRSG